MITWEQIQNTSDENGNIRWQAFFDERQMKEIRFDQIYETDFAHGTDGHNARLIIAKMAYLLDSIAANVKSK